MIAQVDPTPVRRKTKAVVDHSVHCPECGVDMVRRVGKHGKFFGCQRFPLCVGTRPIDNVKAKPYDSFTQLLLDAHSAAVHYLARPALLGRMGAVQWWLEHPNALTDSAVLERVINAASAKAAELGYPKDFLQEAHDARVADILTRFSTKQLIHMYDASNIRTLPKPKFLRRWDTSDLDQVESLFVKGDT